MEHTQIAEGNPVNIKAIVLNPMPLGITPLNLRGWLRKTLDAHHRQAPDAKGVFGFLFLSEVYVGTLTLKNLQKTLDAMTKKYPMMAQIAVVYDDGERLTDAEAESVISSFYRPGSSIPDFAEDSPMKIQGDQQ